MNKTGSKVIKDKIDKLKISKLNKNNYILSIEDKDSFIDFIEQVDNTSKKNNEISFLKFKIHDIQNPLNYWKDKFEKLISFLHDKLHSWYDKDDKYIDVVNDMYEDNVFDDDDIEDLDLSKEEDDYER